MNSTTMMELRRFPVLVERLDNHEVYAKHITLTKGKVLDAGKNFGQGVNGMINCLCELQGYKLAEVGKPEKKTVCINLDALWRDGSNGE